MSWFDDAHCCYRGGAKHDFEARYTEVDSSTAKRITHIPVDYDNFGSQSTLSRTLKPLNQYVHDVCRWCGKVVR